MASKKITAMPNWAGAQVPTDLLTGVDLSQPAATENVKTTLNDVFQEITKNITDLSVQFGNGVTATVSAAGKGKLRYNGTTDTFQVSQNGAAYVDLMTSATAVPGGSNKQVQFNDAGVFGGAEGFEYQSGISPNVSITAQDNAHRALEIKPASAAYTVYPFAVLNGAGTHGFFVDPNRQLGAALTAFISDSGDASFGAVGGTTNAAGVAAFARDTSGTITGIYAVGDGNILDPLIRTTDTGVVYSDSPIGMTIIAFGTSAYLRFGTGGTALANERMRIDANGNVVIGLAALATNATDGFFYLDSMAGTPSGTPTAYTGRVPLTVDTSGSALYGYFGGSWVNLSTAGGIGPAGPTNSVQINNGGGLFDGSQDFIFDPLTGIAVVGSNAGLSGTVRIINTTDNVYWQFLSGGGVNQEWLGPTVLPSIGQFLIASNVSGSSVQLAFSDTFLRNVTFEKAVYQLTEALTISGGAIATNATLSNRFRVTLDQDATLSNPTNTSDNQQCVWEIIQDGTGGHTLTLGSKFNYGTTIPAPTIDTTANSHRYITAVYNATQDKWNILGDEGGYV